MAHLVQKPHERIESAIVLRGARGSGKGVILTNFLFNIIGEEYSFDVKNMEQIIGRFNKKLRSCLLAFLDEAAFAGSHQTVQAIKKLITDKHVPIEEKFKDMYTVQSFLHLIIATNDEWSFPAGDFERRLLCLNLDAKYAGQQETTAARSNTMSNKQYFDELLRVPLKAVAYYLYTRDIRSFDFRQIPVTDELRNQQRLSLRGIKRFVHELLDDANEYKRQYEKQSFSKDTIYERYENFLTTVNEKFVGAASQFWKDMSKTILYDSKRQPGNGPYYIVFGTLKESRAKFENCMGVTASSPWGWSN